MDRKEKKPVKMSVPQFGGWEHKSAGVPPPDYSVVFNQAREKKKTQKNDLTEVKRLSLGEDSKRRLSLGSDRGSPKPSYRRGGGLGHAHGRDHEDPPVLRLKKGLGLSYMNCFHH